MGRIADFFSGQLAMRTLGEPLEGTNMSLYQSIIPNWWDTNINGSMLIGDASLVDRVWVANRCQQLNAQQIASMPLEFHGRREPAWVSSPDPNLYPNGIGDALHSIVDQIYGWGFSCQYITSSYDNGFPRTWTVLPSAAVHMRWENGTRAYKLGETDLDARLVVQIDRNPSTRLHGTSALSAYAQSAWGLLAASNQSMTVNQGGIPQMYFQPQKKMTAQQAEDFQTQWMTATARRNGAPPVLPTDIEAKQLSFDPASLSLLDNQEWNARTLASAYGVPSVILNMALQGGLTYQNPMALMQMWWLTELRTTSKRIMDAFTAQMLPRGQWISQDASDITSELDAESAEDDPQLSQVAKASPAQQSPKLAAIGGTG